MGVSGLRSRDDSFPPKNHRSLSGPDQDYCQAFLGRLCGVSARCTMLPNMNGTSWAAPFCKLPQTRVSSHTSRPSVLPTSCQLCNHSVGPTAYLSNKRHKEPPKHVLRLRWIMNFRFWEIFHVSCRVCKRTKIPSTKQSYCLSQTLLGPLYHVDCHGIGVASPPAA